MTRVWELGKSSCLHPCSTCDGGFCDLSSPGGWLNATAAVLTLFIPQAFSLKVLLWVPTRPGVRGSPAIPRMGCVPVWWRVFVSVAGFGSENGFWFTLLPLREAVGVETHGPHLQGSVIIGGNWYLPSMSLLIVNYWAGFGQCATNASYARTSAVITYGWWDHVTPTHAPLMSFLTFPVMNR